MFKFRNIFLRLFTLRKNIKFNFRIDIIDIIDIKNYIKEKKKHITEIISFVGTG